MLITQMHNITVSRKSEKCMNYEGAYQKVSPITNMNTVKKENVKRLQCTYSRISFVETLLLINPDKNY